MYYIYNGKLLQNSQKVKINPFSDGTMYGYGLFETIKVSNKKPVLLKEHLDRLRKGLKDLEIVVLYSNEKIKEMIEVLIEKNGHDGAIKLAVIKNKNISDLVVIFKETNYKKADYNNGFKLQVSDVLRNSTSNLVKYKTLNYFENYLEFKNAKLNGFDEVIFFNEKGYLCEGAISNIFIVKSNKVYTPSIDNGLLNGIMRKKVKELLNDDLIEGNIEKEFVMNADEVFITNSLMEIMPVREIESLNFKSKDFRIAKLLRKKLYGDENYG